MRLLFLCSSRSLAWLLVLSLPTWVWAAACCGGGFSSPSLIGGDERAQFSGTFSTTNVVVDHVDTQGIWRKTDAQTRVQVFRLDGAHIFKDRYQVGISIPIIERRQGSISSQGVGDLSATLGYEFLPDWDYNPYRPKGIGYLLLTLPTGKSKAESELGGLDSRGNGLWSYGAGVLLSKSWARWDGFFDLQAHRSLDKSVSSSTFTGELRPGYGGQLGIGMGYNIKDYRWGSSITWSYEDAIETRSSTGVVSQGSIERFATATASASYLFDDEWTGTISYSDQTLFGSPVNTSLGQGLLVRLQRRWSR